MTITLNAYVLLADPAWIEASVLRYYDRVRRIVASYDEDSIGWSGQPINVAECIERLRVIDRAGKVHFLPGRYHDIPHDHLLEVETLQRQDALDEAGSDSDWVVQLDTDEVLLEPDTFFRAIGAADLAGHSGLHYPARWLFARLAGSIYLERATRRGRTWGVVPGDVAVRRASRLRLARAHDGASFEVTWSRRVTADLSISKSQAIAHLSTIRTDEEMQAKALTNGHARDFDWTTYLQQWTRAHDRPLTTVAKSFRPTSDQPYRLALVRGASTAGEPWR